MLKRRDYADNISSFELCVSASAVISAREQLVKQILFDELDRRIELEIAI